MNRLKVLKKRIARSGDVGIIKLSGGYVVASGRFQGACSEPMTKRSAVLTAARWAMPSKPQKTIVIQGSTVTTTIRAACGKVTTHVLDLGGDELKDLALQAFYGMHAKLFDLMLDRGLPNWRSEGARICPRHAEEWIQLLSKEEIENALTSN